MKTLLLMLGLVVIALSLGACDALSPTPTGQGVDDPTVLPSTPNPPVTAEQVSESVRQLLAQQLQLPADQVNVVAIEAMQWPDTCLGAATADEMCASAITPGYRLQFESAGATYLYHTNQDGSDLRLVQAPEPAIGEMLLAWAAVEPPCTEAFLGAEGLAFGRCDAPRMAGSYVVAGRAAELQRLVNTYAAFQAQTLAGNVTFNGKGVMRATGAEQRMIAAWAAQALSEAEAGATGTGQSPTLAWHREGGIAGFCDDVTVNRWGLAYLGSCRGETPTVLSQRLLTADELTQLYQWHDTLAPFEAEQADAATADGMLVRTLFFGVGQANASAEEQQAIAEFAALLVVRWAEMAETSYVMAQQDLSLFGGPGEQFAAMGQVFAGQTAQVTGRSRDGAWWRVVCPDGTMGNCWVSADPAQTQPTTASPRVALSPGDHASILAAVIRQVYEIDHTFGQPPQFPVLYLTTSDPDLSTDIQSAVLAALSQLPARVSWISTRDEAPVDEQGRIRDNGAMITVGAVAPQPDGSVQVEGSIFVAPLMAGGRTYVVQRINGVWQITGDTGQAWIS